MGEIDPSHVKETSFTCSLVIHWIPKAACSFRMFERLCLRQRRLFTFIRHYASREVSCGMLTKVCRARIIYLKLSCFLHYPLTVWSHLFTGCSQGGKVTFGNTLCTFKNSPHLFNLLDNKPLINESWFVYSRLLYSQEIGHVSNQQSWLIGQLYSTKRFVAQATNLRRFRASVYPWFYDGIPDFMAQINTFHPS